MNHRKYLLICKIFLLINLQFAYAQHEIALKTAEHFTETVEENVSETVSETVEYGPITAIIDNLSEFAVSVSDESSQQLQSSIERTVANLNGNIEVLIVNALAQLSDSVYRANDIFTNFSNCNPTWNADEFLEHIETQLSNCTQDTRNTLEAFRNDGNALVSNVQSLVQQIAQLPIVCRLLNAAAPLNLGATFANGTSCFAQRMVDINQQMNLAMHSASLLLMRTRQLSQQSISSAEQCADTVVAQANDYLNAQLENCT